MRGISKNDEHDLSHDISQYISWSLWLFKLGFLLLIAENILTARISVISAVCVSGGGPSHVVLVVKSPPANEGDTRDGGSIPG